jgi:hypothetical protein
MARRKKNTYEAEVIAKAMQMTADRLLAEHGARETALLYQQHALLALEMTGTYSVLNDLSPRLPPGQQGYFRESLNQALVGHMGMQAQIAQRYQRAIAGAGAKPEPGAWEQFGDGLSLAATVATFGLVRKRKE